MYRNKEEYKIPLCSVYLYKITIQVNVWIGNLKKNEKNLK